MTDPKEMARRMFEVMCNQRDLDIVTQICSPQLTFREPASIRSSIGRGPMEWAKEIAIYQNGFSDAHWEVHEILESEGKNIIVTWTGSGTHDGMLGNIPATGCRVEIEAITILQFDDDNKIVEITDMWDVLRLMQQIGVVPIPSAQTSSSM